MTDTSIPQKRCSKCKRELPANPQYFDRDRRRAIGLQPRCKECRGRSFLAFPRHVPQDGYQRCTKCGVEYPATVEYFSPDKRKRSGLVYHCRACHNQYGKTPEARAHKRAAYHTPEGKAKAIVAARSDRRKAYERSDRAREISRLSSQRYNAKPQAKEGNRRRANARYKTPEGKAKAAAYGRSERGKIVSRTNRHRRRARKRNLADNFTTHDWQYALDYFGGCCAVCGRPPGLWHVLAQEHWIAIADQRPDNPGTVATNIVPMCHSMKDGEGGCNNSKFNRDPLEWLNERFGKRKAKLIHQRIQAYFDSLK